MMSLKLEVSIKCIDCTTRWERTYFPRDRHEAAELVDRAYDDWYSMGWMRRGCNDFCPKHAVVQKSEAA